MASTRTAETDAGRKFREATIAHDRAKQATNDALTAWDRARDAEGVARRAESKAKRELLKEARS